MKVIHTFSSQTYQKISDLDLILWLNSCISYKKLNYKLKLYCLEKDIQFLKDNLLYNFYDEIDTETFANSEILKKVDGKNFWFIRKMAAMLHEFQINSEEFVYSDTDVFCIEPFNLENTDVLVWCMEDYTHSDEAADGECYTPWKNLSLPEGYKLPDYIESVGLKNYNTGLLYFKNKTLYEDYARHVLDFAVNNPCILTDTVLLKNTKEKDRESIKQKVFAINAEQRILTGFCRHNNLKVKCFDPEGVKYLGCGKVGSHYFMVKSIFSKFKELATQGGYIGFQRKDIIAICQLLDALRLFTLNQLTQYPKIKEFVSNLNLFKELEKINDSMFTLFIN